MPELPEVETMRRILEPQLTGAKILNIQIYNEKIIAHSSIENFRKNVQDKRYMEEIKILVDVAIQKLRKLPLVDGVVISVRTASRCRW